MPVEAPGTATSGVDTDMPPLSFDEMIRLIEQHASDEGISTVEVIRPSARPVVRLFDERDPQSWVQITLDDEIFFIRVDLGFRIVDSATEVGEQIDLLNDFVDLATAYFRGEKRIERWRGLLGRPRKRLRVIVNGSERILVD